MTLPAVATLDDGILTADPLTLPPQRRLMVFLMLSLAVLLHVATNGWGPVENGRDGWNAAVSRQLALGLNAAQMSELWDEKVAVTPVQWLTAQSFQFLGANEFAARLPFGIASVLIVWLVFLTGERLGGMWQGLVCGIVASTTSGAILHGRDGGGAMLAALAFCGALYALVRMLEQRSRLHWQAAFWGAMALLLTLQQEIAATLLLFCALVAAAFFREARIRLRLPWFLGLVAVFGSIAIFRYHPPVWHLPLAASFQKVIWTLFPWSVIVFPPCIFRLGKIIRLSSLSPAEVILWSATSLSLLWLVLTPLGEIWPASAAILWPLFALLAGQIWERLSSGQRILGIVFLIVLALGGMKFCGRVTGKEWLNLLQPIWWLSCSVIVVFGISAIISVRLRHSRAALLTLAASIVPLAFNLLDARVRHNWADTMKDLGRRAEMEYRPSSRVQVSENLVDVSGFLFYAPHDLQVRKMSSPLGTSAVSGDYLLWPRDKPPAAANLENLGGNRTHVLSVFKG